MFEYPKKARQPLRKMPKTLLIQSFSKVGKSTIAAGLTTDFRPGKSCVVSLGEEGSYDNHTVNEIKIEKMSKFEAQLNDMIEKQPYEFVIFDHLSKFDEWTETLGTLEYMNTAMGKSFNYIPADNWNGTGTKPKGPGYKKDPSKYHSPLSKSFRSVHTLADGAGYRFSRECGKRLYHKMKKCAPYVIFIGHIKEDRFSKDDSGKITKSQFLDVTGGLGRYICKDIDALCTLSRKKDEGFLSFKTGHSDLSAGCRYDYLENNTFKISEKINGKIITYWSNIYPT